MKHINKLLLVVMLLSMVAACQPVAPVNGEIKVLAIESFLGDLTSQVAGGSVTVETLIPAGIDLHGYQPSPQDIARAADANLIIANGAGLEGWLQDVILGASQKPALIEASAGIPLVDDDPHVWLDPILVQAYVDNIRAGLSALIPAESTQFAANAVKAKISLIELDGWIREQVALIPADRRILVTNHESLGYFAARYGFTVLGSIIPSHDAIAETSAQHLTELISQIKATGAPAIFLETGSNPQLALQLEQETGIKVVTGFYTHSTDDAAPTYADMMRANVLKIVEALR